MKAGKATCVTIVKLVLLTMPALAETAKIQLKAGPGQTVPKDPAKHDGKINADFPEPTDIRDIAKAFSLWSGTEYIVDDDVQKKVKLISPERVTKEEALRRFLRMLTSYNLKSIAEGNNYRIVQDMNPNK
jgi:type II secretory pathway component GspD/PulD (secretin)